jgi:phage baseplate assembly protein W
MPINLSSLLKTKKQDNTPLYRDIAGDLSFDANPTIFPFGQARNKTDIKTSLNEYAVLNSFVNIMNTTPGEKLLNPELGINFKKYLFAPITQATLMEIARDLTEKLPQQEPRLRLRNVMVNGIPDQHTILIDLEIIIPSLNNAALPVRGALSENGFRLLA